MEKLAFLITLAYLSFLADAYELTNDIDYHSLNESLELDGDKEYQDDSDNDLPTMDLIERAGYPAEAHVVTTSDGYILTLHRIPGGPGSIPVLLQHGLLCSSADWVITGRGKSLAYILADKGYDVWLGNARGNTYSRAHTTLSTSDSKFWDFSWDEMGLYDLPAVITYITNYKSETLIYIGHSMGTTMFYVMASRRPDIADKVRAMIALAPIGYINHMKSPMRLFAPFINNFEIIAHFLGADEFLPQNAFIKFLARYGCEIDAYEEKICANSLFVICGFDSAQFNYTLMPLVLSHTPAGTSTKTVVHYGQETDSGHFRAYDYGPVKNRKYYNSSAAPDYDMSDVNVPIAFICADNDWLASSTDVNRLWQQLPKKIEKYRVNYAKFNHLDFLYAIDAPKLVYEQILSVMKNYHGSNAASLLLH